jgi:hypothetical protein
LRHPQRFEDERVDNIEGRFQIALTQRRVNHLEVTGEVSGDGRDEEALRLGWFEFEDAPAV